MPYVKSSEARTLRVTRGRADLGSLLLRTDDPVEAGRIAFELDRLNGERRAMEAAMLEEALAEAQAALDI